MARTFDEFYSAVKEQVNNLLINGEIQEGNLCFEKIVGNVIKDFMLQDGDIKIRQIKPRDEQNYPTKNILYVTKSKRKLNAKSVGIK